MANTDARYLIRDYGPLVLFASITIGGMIFIWSSKLMGWSLPVVTGVPLVLMGIYFFVSLAVAGFRLHNEQAGDNLYYMGFLFTLSSLGVSLYLFAGETSIETIVRNFGIAVTSTIAGVTLRILFNQMRRDPIDIERSVRHELAEMTRRVRTELDSSSREFSHYRRVSNQMLSEGFEEIAHQAERNGQEINKILELLAKQAVTPINDAAAQLTATTSQLSEIIGKFGTAVESVGKKLEEIRSPEDVVRAELAPAITAIKEMSEAQLQPLRNIELALGRMAEAMGQTPLPKAGSDIAAELEVVPRKRWWHLW
jgi:methyl-accepting chemotaxis protein